jgi:hypothetical protein
MSVPVTTLSLALVGVTFFSTEEAHRLLLVLHCAQQLSGTVFAGAIFGARCD